jgi:hypothetical protein
MWRTVVKVGLVVVLLAACGCSVGMALSGKQDPNLSVVRSGASRGEIELQLGAPISVIEEGKDRCRCLYEYDMGNSPSAGRAIAHGAMDVLTLGIWEAVGTPIEGFKGDKRRLQIVYGPDNKVVDVVASAPPPAPVKAEAVSGDSKQ